jgi:DNA-directed RNA polymerase specialized sigma24 family protein
VALSPDAFKALLASLDPDPDRAGERYEDIRIRLVKFFEWRQSPCPEELADETLDRVGCRLRADATARPDNRPAYLYGIARNVLRESWKERSTARHRARLAPAEPAVPTADTESEERRLECLDRCLGGLPEDSRELILQYYQFDRGDQIEHRRRIAEAHRIPLNALRVRVHRIRATLEPCVRDCLSGAELRPRSFPDPPGRDGGQSHHDES